MVDKRERERTQFEKPDMMFKRPNSLVFNEESGLYGKPTEKFIGYCQFPSGRVNPYFNDKKNLMIDPAKRRGIPKADKDIKIKSDKNKSLFRFDPPLRKKGKRELDSVPNFLRTMSSFGGTRSGFNTTHQSGFGHHRLPHDSLNATQTFTNFDRAESQNNLNRDCYKIGQIHVGRYQNKVNRIRNKRDYVFFKDKENIDTVLDNYNELMEKISENAGDSNQMNQTMFSMKTFNADYNKTNHFDYTKQDDDTSMLKNAASFKEILRMEKEIKNIKLKEQFVKRDGRVTKGMFKSDIPSPGRLYKKNREFMKQLYPQMYEEP